MTPPERKKLNEMEAKLTPEQFQEYARQSLESLNEAMKGYLFPLIAERAALVSQEMRDKVGCTVQVVDLAADLAKRWGEDPETVLLKGLILYRTAREAMDNGNSLVIIDPEDTVVENITNVETAAAQGS